MKARREGIFLRKDGGVREEYTKLKMGTVIGPREENDQTITGKLSLLLLTSVKGRTRTDLTPTLSVTG